MAVNSNRNKDTQTHDQKPTMGAAMENAGFTRGASQPADNRSNPQYGNQVWSQMGRSGITSGLSFSMESEQLTKLAAMFKEIYASLADALCYKIITVDKASDSRLAASVVIVSLFLKEKKDQVIYFTNILARPASDLDPRQYNFSGRNYEVPRFTSDTYTPEMNEVVRERLRENFGSAEFFCAQGQIVPAYIKPDDKNDCWPLAVNAVQACTAQLNMLAPDYQPLNMRAFTGTANKQSTERLECRIEFGCDPKPDFSGYPLRRDIRVVISSVPVGNRNNESMGGGRTEICSVSAYVELLSIGQAHTINQYVPQQQQQQIQPRFQPVIVITDIENSQLKGPEAQMMAALAVAAIPQSGAWINGLNPQQRMARPRDMSDIGGIGHELNLEQSQTGFGQAIPTQSDSFMAPGAFNAIVGAYMVSSPLIAFDVPDLTGAFWLNNVFSSAALGNRTAINDIIEAADTLFDGEFAPRIGNASLFMGAPMLMHGGYYEGADGIRRPINDCDYLAVANHFGATNPTELEKWNWSFAGVDCPEEVRLAERLGLIRQVLGGRVVLTGWSNRVLFSTEFIDSMLAAASACGYSVVLNYARDNEGEYQARFAASWLQRGQVSGSAISGAGLFHSNTVRNQGNAGGNESYLSRSAGWSPNSNRRNW